MLSARVVGLVRGLSPCAIPSSPCPSRAPDPSDLTRAPCVCVSVVDLSASVCGAQVGRLPEPPRELKRGSPHPHSSTETHARTRTHANPCIIDSPSRASVSVLTA
eukprot:scaffold10469_cov118-Isochrysis_galbana.AAC.11